MGSLRHNLQPIAHALLLCGAAFILAVSALAQSTDRATVHAAFTLNIARFVAWPDDAFASADAPLVIGTAEHDPINTALDHAAGLEPIQGRPVHTRRIRSLEDLSECHLVFLSEDTPQQPSILARVKDLPVLTIGASPGFLELGGHVAFVTHSSRVTVRVNPARLKSSGLEARAQLLRLAQIATP
jgi:YfiR/HmsC-like